MKKSDVKLIASAAKKLVYTRKNEVIFLTGTFSSWLYDRQANAAFCLFLKNGVETYNFNNYVWTKELQGRGVPHYHFLVDFPYASIQTLQEAYNHSIRTVCGRNFPVSNNSLRLPSKRERSIVKDHTRVAIYLAKYAAKSLDTEYSSRCWAISKGLYPLYVNLNDSQAQTLKDTFENKQFGNEFASYTHFKFFDFYQVEALFNQK